MYNILRFLRKTYSAKSVENFKWLIAGTESQRKRTKAFHSRHGFGWAFVRPLDHWLSTVANWRANKRLDFRFIRMRPSPARGMPQTVLCESEECNELRVGSNLYSRAVLVRFGVISWDVGWQWLAVVGSGWQPISLLSRLTHRIHRPLMHAIYADLLFGAIDSWKMVCNEIGIVFGIFRALFGGIGGENCVKLNFLSQ